MLRNPTVLFRSLTIAALWAFSNGCDTISYIRLNAPLAQYPKPAQVESVLRQIPELTEVEHSDSSWSVSGESNGSERAADNFRYQSKLSAGGVEIRQTAAGNRTITVGTLWMNHIPNAAEAKTARDLMNLVYESLQKDIPGIPPASDGKIVEYRISNR